MDTLPDVAVLERDEFLAEYWDYRPGEHVTIIGPNGRGKTYLGFQLLQKTSKCDMRAYVLVSKPRDETVDEWQKPLKYGLAEEWPPPISFRKKPGYFVRPPQYLKNLDADNERLRHTFKQCIMDCYGSVDTRIVFADEAHELQHELRLKPEMEAVWMRGRSLKTGMWALAQRSAHNSMHMYNAPNHVFLFNDPDKRNRDRFSEIGGIVDSRAIEDITRRLGTHQVLYLNRIGQYCCVVNP